jgi:hypothetical protein
MDHVLVLALTADICAQSELQTCGIFRWPDKLFLEVESFRLINMMGAVHIAQLGKH